VDGRGHAHRLLRFPNARRRRIARSVLQSFFGFLSHLSPRIGAIPAELLFLSPPPHRRTRAEAALLERGVPSRVPFAGGSLAVWTWGDGPRVLLVHGWGGHAARLARFVGPLVAAGFGVVAFDAPAHGASSGRRCSLPDFVDAVLAVADATGPLVGVVAHSMGATAVALALRRGLRLERAVFLAPPADPERYVGRFARFFGIPDLTLRSMKARLTARYRTRWEDLRVDAPCGGASCRLLVFHDGGDASVPLSDGAAIVGSWGDASLVKTTGLGHHRILREPGVVADAMTFLARDPCPAVPAAGG
jgi:pimeloyl-ACP methyl ester carboxylesterase